MPPDLDPARLPTHVAMIMDGNGRWAKKRLKNRVIGHEQGAEVVRRIVKMTRRLGIPVLTLYAFSTENWGRPRSEVDALMRLLKKFLVEERALLSDNDIRLSVIGEMDRLPASVQAPLHQTLEMTANNQAMVLNLALSYGGRSELVHAVRAIAGAVSQNALAPDAIDEQTISDHLFTRSLPDPDVMIRTSGEMRISNFLLWQLAYTEIFFTDTLWPDFSETEYVEILKAYQHRDRRFGKVNG
ncbi:MAG: isoprenyl transferase [Deltaproteobacteria bacterium]|nr:MAG: isoprenyl transferase [Deltaproteobacteria bacterium]